MTVLRALTVRGRAFLTSGATAALCGLALLERDLVRAGLLVALLPLVASGVLALRRRRLGVARSVEPTELSVGGAGTVTLSLTNGADGSAGLLLVEEHLPATLGQPVRFAVPRIERGGTADLEYVVRPTLRGHLRLGPLSTRTREPFGLAERHREVAGTHDVLVLPRVVDLAPIRLRGDDFTTGDERPRAYASGNVADAVVRTYRRGDDLRRVHWRSTARVGELMVRNEEQLWQPRAVVLLDDRVVAHRGQGIGSSLEAAVTAAASVVTHLAERGYRVRLVCGSGVVATDRLTGDPHAVLEHLALIGPTQTTSLPVVPIDEEVTGSVVIGIAGLPTDPQTTTRDQDWWGRFPTSSATALVLALDADAWGARTPEGAPAALWLARQGWRSAALGRDGAGVAEVALAEAWRGLDR